MTHYICTGTCGTELKNPGICEARFCPKEGEPLVECNCEDGLHEETEENDFDDEADGVSGNQDLI